MITEKNEICLIEEINDFVSDQLMVAKHIVEEGYRENALSHLYGVFAEFLHCEHALEDLSAFVSCDNAILIVTEGREKIYQMILNEQG